MIDGTETKVALFIAENFNSYFTILGQTLAEKNPHSSKSCDAFMPHTPPCSFDLLPTSFLEIIQISSLLKILLLLHGIDGINSSIARCSISLVATPLSWIFNSSFNLGLISDSLKIAKITPIFKSCPKDLISNYRPISILEKNMVAEKNMVVEPLYDIMNSELEKIVEWFNINKLSLNPDKTNYILFRSPKTEQMI